MPHAGSEGARAPAAMGLDLAGLDSPRGVPGDLTGIEQVIAPLFGGVLDGFEMITVLAGARFRGRLCLVGTALPNPRMVLNELRSLAQPLGIEVEMSTSRSNPGPRKPAVLHRLPG